MDWDFPGCPVVTTSPSNAGGTGLIPGWGVNALWPKNQNIKQKQYCKKKNSKFNKDFKNSLHLKKSLKNKWAVEVGKG